METEEWAGTAAEQLGGGGEEASREAPLKASEVSVWGGGKWSGAKQG